MPQTIRLGSRFAVEGTAGPALQRVEQYLRAAGYEAEEVGAGRVCGHRGRRGLTPFSFSPRAWRVEVEVTVAPTEGRLEGSSVFTVTVDGQVPTAHENAFWCEEVFGLERAVGQGDVSASHNRALARRALVRNLLAVPVLFTMMLGPLVPVVQWFESQAQESPWFVPALLGTVVLAGAATLAVAQAWLGLFASTEELPLLED